MVTFLVRMAKRMLTAPSSPGTSLRLVRRPVNPSPKTLSVRLVPPSVLDLSFRGDLWIIARQDGAFVLCLGDYEVSSLSGLALDLPSLKPLLDSACHRRPRVGCTTRPGNSAYGCQVR